MENENEPNAEPGIRSAESTPQSEFRIPHSNEILIVEDSPVEAEMLRRTLVRAGYRVTLATNGEEGLQALREHPCTLVMSDINMPLMSGYELCRTIKFDEKLWSTPVILVTTLSEPKDIIMALDVGADGYVTKPYVEDVLLGRIRSLLANPSRRKLAEERRNIQVEYGGERHSVAVDSPQMVNLLLSVYENSLNLNQELMHIQNQLSLLNGSLDEKVRARTAALEESEERFRKITESAQDAIIMMGADRRVSFWNAAATRIFGYTAAEAMGRELHALVASAPARAGFAQAFPYFQEMGEGPIIGKVREIAALRKGGEEFPVELSISAIRLNGSWHAIGIVRDITERKRMEQALRDSEEKFRAIFDGALDGIVLTDAKTRQFIIGNPAFCRMLGYSLEEIARIGVSDIHPQQDLPHVVEQFEQVLCGKIQLAADIPVKRKDGSVIYADINGSIVDFGGKTYLLGIFRDITERKQVEIQLNAQLEELRRWHEATLGMGMHSIELKREVNELLVQAGQSPRYPSAEQSNAE